MARKPRIEFAGAVYHVVSRGDRGEPIYQDDEDRRLFLQFLGEVCERAGWLIHAFVAMTNHYHLLLETPEPNLVVGMKWLQGRFAQRFNLRHRLRGHLFQGRYKALLIDGEEPGHFLQVSSYSHLNPVRAGLIKAHQPLKIYPWSSFPSYLAPPRKRIGWVYVDRVFGELGYQKDSREIREKYGKYMEELAKRCREEDGKKELEEKWKPLRRGWYMGDEGFLGRLLEHMEKKLEGKGRESYLGEELREYDERQALKMLKKGLEVLGIKQADLEAKMKGTLEKQVMAWWLRKKTVVNRKWISDKLRMGDLSRVTNAVKEVESGKGSKVQRWKTQLEKNS
ncbi:MAG: transposase [Deltaproteobacteria bacterium]|nr:transposase [Deltaproteobacteria bacterium]